MRNSWVDRRFTQRSNIPDFLSILSDIFAKEPPVVSRTPQQQQRPVQPLPPPVPPLPREMQPPSHQNTAVSGPTPPQQQTGSPTPPPPPPKPSTQGGVSSPSPGPQAQKPGRYDAPPPLPPEVQAQDQPRPQHSYGPNGSVQRPLSGMNYMPQRISSLRQSIPAQRPSHQQQPHQPAYESPQHRTQPVRPGEGQQYASPAPHQPLPQQALGMMGPPLGQGQGYDQSRPLPDQYRQPPAQGHHGRPLSQHHPTSHPDPPHQPQQPLPPKPIQPNLLDSPFDIPLPVPTSTTHQSNVPAPPIPRNPEKEALLTHLSHQLTTSLHSQITQSTSALPALSSQNAALQSTLHTLTSELQNLQTLHSTLTSNLTLLRTSLSKSDNVISTAHARAAKNDIPAVDEMLTPPNVVARQLYDAACEERGIEAAILALQEGFVCGRVPAEVWSRRTRELAREGFKRRWMERKVASGMGLDLMAFRS